MPQKNSLQNRLETILSEKFAVDQTRLLLSRNERGDDDTLLRFTRSQPRTQGGYVYLT